MKYNLPKYKILTSFSCLDIPDMSDMETQAERERLYNEQWRILKNNGFNSDKLYEVHFFNSAFFYEVIHNFNIDDAVQCLAIKDGTDLVQFENGNLGFVAYYNGRENGFEILGEEKEEE